MSKKPNFLAETIEQIDITGHNFAPLIESLQWMTFSGRETDVPPQLNPNPPENGSFRGGVHFASLGELEK